MPIVMCFREPLSRRCLVKCLNIGVTISIEKKCSRKIDSLIVGLSRIKQDKFDILLFISSDNDGGNGSRVYR